MGEIRHYESKYNRSNGYHGNFCHLFDERINEYCHSNKNGANPGKYQCPPIVHIDLQTEGCNDLYQS